MEAINLLEKALSIRGYYHKVIASNIANIETPGYKEKDIDFQAELKRSMDGSTGEITIMEKSNPLGKDGIDGNSVDMEDQVVKLSENTMMFSAFVQLINKKFSMMKYAISGSGR